MQIADAFPSIDGITTKYLLRANGSLIECTYVNRPEKHIICFSTAVGCPVHCVFCAATSFRRRLSATEMTSQALTVAALAAPSDSTKPILFSAMGEGEPLLSKLAAATLVEAFTKMLESHPNARVAVATSAVKPSLIHWLAEVAPANLKLQISLHAPTDEQRKSIIPQAAPITAVIDAGRAFGAVRPGKLEWNYVLIAGLNDQDNDARLLSRLLDAGDKVKLNRLNPVPGLSLQPSGRALEFAAALQDGGLEPEHYCTDGVDVAAACGQLKSKVARGYEVRRSDALVVP